MKNNVILTIFKKELARFFKDKRTLIALLLPGILLYVIYSIMGGAMSDAFAPDEEYIPKISAVALPDSIGAICGVSGIVVEAIDVNDVEVCKQAVADSEIDLVLVFPNDFDVSIADGTSIPNVEIYYNSSSTNSTAAYQTMVAVLDAYESMMANKFDINLGAWQRPRCLPGTAPKQHRRSRCGRQEAERRSPAPSRRWHWHRGC